MAEQHTSMQRVMPDHPVVSAVLWHVPAIRSEAYAKEKWFTEADLAECDGFANDRRVEEWLAVRIALKSALIQDGVAASPLHIHIRKNDKGSPHVVVYNPGTGGYARMSCSLSHKGPLVFAAYSKRSGIRVGIDVEKRSWKLPYLRRRYISEHDRVIDKDDHIGDCTILWAFKEATSKILGSGMAYGFSNIQCRETSVGVCELRDSGGNHYTGRFNWFGRYALAVVTDPFFDHAGAEAKPRRSSRSWYERLSRARRLRALRKKRRITAHIEAIKLRLPL